MKSGGHASLSFFVTCSSKTKCARPRLVCPPLAYMPPPGTYNTEAKQSASYTQTAPIGAVCVCRGAPARNRTSNSGLEVRSYIHLTTGAILSRYSSRNVRGTLHTRYSLNTVSGCTAGVGRVFSKTGARGTELTYVSNSPRLDSYRFQTPRILSSFVGSPRTGSVSA